MNRFPPLAPQQRAKRPALVLAFADLPLGEISVLMLLGLMLALA